MQHIGDHIKAVFFDHDDTLVGTIGPKWEHHKYVAREHYSKDLTDDEIRAHWGKPFRELLCLIYETQDADEAMANNVASQDLYPKELFTASIPALRHLKEIGKLTGIITATTRHNFEKDLLTHNIPRELLDYTQTADDTHVHKPDPKVFKPAIAWLEMQGISPSEVLYIGDGLHDMKAALGAGFSFIGVETGLVTAEQFISAGAFSISSIGELIKTSQV